MKKVFLFLSFFLFLIFANSFADGVKIFQLKDGSSIKGQLVSFGEGVYVVNTQSMGQLQLKESDVSGMVEEGAQMQAPSAQQSQQTIPLQMPASYSNQMQQVQQQLMSNPQLNQQLQSLAQDPEITQLLSDPQLIQEMTAAMNGGNTQNIQQNPKVQQLMQNQKMQSLIQGLQSSLTAPSPQNSSTSSP